jgi:EAL domain-containing protein (putative c-di-GMP-specific phosphodiesterase class I)
MLVDANNAVIVRTIVVLANSLGLSVIADGVETKEQKILLAESGCYHYQGGLFSRPLAADALVALIARQSMP